MAAHQEKAEKEQAELERETQKHASELGAVETPEWVPNFEDQRGFVWT